MFINLKEEIEVRLKKSNVLNEKIKINNPDEFPPFMIDGLIINCIIEFNSEINPRNENPDDYDKAIKALMELRFPNKKFYATLHSLQPQIMEDDYFTSRFSFEFHFLDAPEPPEIEDIVDIPPEKPNDEKTEMKKVFKEAMVEFAVEAQSFMAEEEKETKKEKEKKKKTEVK